MDTPHPTSVLLYLWSRCTDQTLNFASLALFTDVTWYLYLKLDFILKWSPACSSILVSLILQWSLVRHLQTSLPPCPNLCASLPITTFQPQCNTILRLPDRYHTSTNLFPRCIHRLAYQGKNGEEPPLIRFTCLRIHLGDGEHKLPALFVGCVLPHGFYTLFKQMIIAIQRKSAGWFHIIEDWPKIFRGL